MLRLNVMCLRPHVLGVKMNARYGLCEACGSQSNIDSAHYCIHCGSSLTERDSAISEEPMPGKRNETAQYSLTLVNTSRLLSASCMLSGILAIMRFDFSTPMDKGLVFACIVVSLCGQIFVSQATKPTPAVWTNAALGTFWVGLAGITALWWVLLN